MSNKVYTRSETIIKDELETILWCEIARRKFQLAEPENFEALKKLRQTIVDFLNQPRDPKIYFLHAAEHYVDKVFERVQAGKTTFVEQHAHLQPFFPVLSECIKKFHIEITEMISKSSYIRGFTIGSLLHENDLKDLYRWWMEINNSEIRKEFFLEGDYGNQGYNKDEEEQIKPYSINHNAIVPTKIRSFEMYDTHNYDINIDGKALDNKLVLVFDLNNRPASIDQIEKQITLGHYKAAPKPTYVQTQEMKLRREGNYIDIEGVASELYEDLPEFYELEDHILSKIFWDAPKNHTLITKITSVPSNLRGLIVWDIDHNKEKKESLDKVASEIADLSNEQPKFEVDLNKVKKDYRSIKKIIENYSPSNLPW